MSTMTGKPDRESDAQGLRAKVVLQARASFPFFVRSVLGLRRLAEPHLENLAAGTADPKTTFERNLLQSWEDFKGGRAVPQALKWALPS